MKLFQEMNREELRTAAPTSLAVLPIGATEQHGPHLPTGTGVFAVESVAREAAARLPDDVPVIVARTLPFGSSHHHFVFGATLSLSTETYFRVLCDLVESLVTAPDIRFPCRLPPADPALDRALTSYPGVRLSWAIRRATSRSRSESS